MFDNSRKRLARALGVLALIGCALSAFADSGTLTTSGADTLTGAPPTFTITGTPGNVSFTAKKTASAHSFVLSAYVSSTNGPETAVTLNPAGLTAGGSYTLVLGSNTLQVGGVAPGTTLATGTSISSPPTESFTSGVTVTVPTTAAPGTYTGTITYTLSLNGGTVPTKTVAYSYAVVAPVLSNLTVSPNPVIGSIGSTGTVTLASVAPTGGQTVSLGSNSANVVVPPSVIVAAGSTTGTFAITTTAPATTLTATISASTTSPSSSKTANLQVYANYITGLTLTANTVLGGASTTGTVSLYQGASAAYSVNLSTQYPATVKCVPSTLTFATGATSATFNITTTPSSGSTTCGIFAADGTSGHNATLAIQGDSIASLVLDAPTIVGGVASGGTITLAHAAPSLGWVVSLTSEYPSSVTVPSTVTFASGATSMHFNFTSALQSRPSIVCGVYSSDGVSRVAAQNANLTVLGDSITSMTLSTTTVTGGTSVTGTINLAANAPAGGWVVNIKTQFPSSVAVLSTVTVPEGTSSTTFSISTQSTVAQYTSNVSASDGLSGANVTLTITP